MNQGKNSHHAQWFRDSSPYINAHKDKTFVLHLPGEAIAGENFRNTVKDVLLLNSLGIKLIIVHGAAFQIDQKLEQEEISSEVHAHVRITTTEILSLVEAIVGKIRIQLEAALSRGVVNAPSGQKDVLAISGNFLKARPMGIVKGIDFQHTGRVRKINSPALRNQLDAGNIVLISSLGPSPSGEIFNINSAEVATELASAIKADKLIFLSKEHGVRDEKNQIINEIQLDDLDGTNIAPNEPLFFAQQACQKGVDRCHLIGFEKDGALLEELFTRDGYGTQITRRSYEQIRQADAADVGGILELIRPLEEEGILKRRPRELIEGEIDRFTVISRDGMIIACAALYPFNQSTDDPTKTQGELACLATHADYRNANRGERLLKAIVKAASKNKLTSLFVLTTQSAHWFLERGFVEKAISTLPESKQSLYNYQRNSKFFEKTLGSASQEQ